jgi:hypothetical protein
MKNIKYLFLLLMGLVVGFAFTACSDDDDYVFSYLLLLNIFIMLPNLLLFTNLDSVSRHHQRE